MKLQWQRDIVKELEFTVGSELRKGRVLTRIDLDSYEFVLFLDAISELIDIGKVSLIDGHWHYLNILVKEVK